MAKLKWHTAGSREIEAGVSEVILFPMESDGSYANGIAWNGVTAVNENPSGADVTDLYADNIKYASMTSAEKFGFTIEAFTYPNEWSECDGSAEAKTGVFLGQQPRKAFGLCYKTQIGDETHPGMNKGYKLHIMYNSTAGKLTPLLLRLKNMLMTLSAKLRLTAPGQILTNFRIW